MIHRSIFPVLLSALVLGGCEPGVFGTFEIESGLSARMDASQRLLLLTNRGGRTGDKRIVCAEPSPDAVVSISAAMTAAAKLSQTLPDGATTEASAAAAATYAQNAAFIGMRTQTIQLLRDGLYRACEAYMNGAIDETAYNMLLVNMPKVMTAMMAIDGLTGRPSAPPVVVPASGLTVNAQPAAGTDAGEVKAGASTINVEAVKTVVVQPDAAAARANAEVIGRMAKGVTEEATMPGICMSVLTAMPDQAGRTPRDDPNFRVVADYCRQVFRVSAHK